MIAVGCGTKATPAPESKPGPATPSQPAPVKIIKLKMATHSAPGQYTNASVFPQWIDKVKEVSGGQVEITLYPAGTLGKIPDEWDMLKTGISDIGWILPMYYPGVFPRVDVSDLPSFMRFSSNSGMGFTRTLSEVELEYIKNVLESVNGNKTQAAKILGIDRKTLREKLSKSIKQ